MWQQLLQSEETLSLLMKVLTQPLNHRISSAQFHLTQLRMLSLCHMSPLLGDFMALLFHQLDISFWGLFQCIFSWKPPPQGCCLRRARSNTDLPKNPCPAVIWGFLSLGCSFGQLPTQWKSCCLHDWGQVTFYNIQAKMLECCSIYIPGWAGRTLPASGRTSY